MSKILIADDEQKIRKLVCDFLKNVGYETLEAEDGDEAFELFQKHEDDIDLVILDIMMPGLNGWEVCKEIRALSDVPVIMLTARSEEFDELLGYESGADDYVTKPFSPTILVKKVEALLRRTKSSAYLAGEKDLTFNHEAHEVRLNGQEIELTLKEYNILKKLLENPGRVYSRENLLNLVWGYDYQGDTRTVDVHIRRLREKLELNPAQPEYIITKWGVGYYFAD